MVPLARTGTERTSWRSASCVAAVAALVLATLVLPQRDASAGVVADPVIAAAGDIACDPTSGAFNGGLGTASACRQMYTADLLEANAYQDVLALGDTQYECGGTSEYAQSYDPSWGRPSIKSVTHPAVGNHEYQTTGGTDCAPGAAGYFSYFGAAAGPVGKGWYSFDIGQWHLIALNSNCNKVSCVAGSEQEQWLAADLAAHSNDCTLAYFHHSVFSAGGQEAQTNAKLLPFWNDLYAAGADLVLSGHDHNYQRLPQLDGSGNPDPVNGVRAIIAGTGGNNLGSPNVQYPGTEFFNTNTFGALELTLRASSYEWRFLKEDNSVIDSGSDTCVTRPPPPTPTVTSFDPTSGNVGTPVTVTGTGFTGATSVTFNGTAAAFTVTNDTTISTSVPTGAATGPIAVTTPGGTGTSGTNFTVTTPPPTPTVTSFDPTSGNVGTPVTVTGTGFTGATSVTFNGTAAAFTVTNDTTISTSVPTGAATGPIAVTTPGGTGTSGTNFTVTTPPPTPTVTSFDPTSGNVGTPVTVTGTGFTGATSVTFNGTAAAFTVTNDTTISTSVPTGAATGPIAVTTPGGTGTSGTNFTVTTPPTGPAMTQHVLNKGGSGPPTATWSQPTGNGNLLVAAIGWTGSGTPTAPAGWSLAKKAGGTAIFYRQGAPTTSGPLTFGGSGIGAWVIDLMEWSGAATSGTLDKTASASSGSTANTTAKSGTTARTSQPSEIAISAIRALKALTQSNPTNGFQQVDVGTQGTNTTGFYSKVLTATGAQNVWVTLSISAKWRGVIATFRGA